MFFGGTGTDLCEILDVMPLIVAYMCIECVFFFCEFISFCQF